MKSLKLAVCVAFSLLCNGMASRAEAAEATPVATASSPNFLFIVLDDLSRSEMTRQYMPNLFRYLADQGTTFDNFILNTPVCGPSRATMLTGLYAHNHGTRFCQPDTSSKYKWDEYFKRGYADNDAGSVMQANGYHTSMVGKYVNSYGLTGIMLAAFGESGHENYLPRGWNDFFVPLDTNYYGYEVIDNGWNVTYEQNEASFRTDVESRRMMQSIATAKRAGKPFLGYFWMGAPHRPETGSLIPSRHAGMFAEEKVPRTPDYNEADMSDKPSFLREVAPLRLARQDALDGMYRERLSALQSVDEAISDVVAFLRSIGELSQTYIFFLTDNGFHLGQHRLTAKLAPYDRVTRVPMIVRGPGVARRLVRPELVGTVDLFPTMLDVLNQPVPDNVDGQSFKRLLDPAEPAPSANWRSDILAEDWVSAYQQGSSGPVLIRFEYSMVRGADDVFIEWWNGEKEYYDLRADPFQLRNTYASLSAGAKARLRARLGALRSCRALSCQQWKATGAPPYSLTPYVQANPVGSGTDSPRRTRALRNPVIRVLSPVPRASIAAGGPLTIRWAPASLASPGDIVRIRLDSGLRGSRTLTGNAANTGTFTWEVPAEFPPGSYRLFLQSVQRPDLAQHVAPISIVAGTAAAHGRQSLSGK